MTTNCLATSGFDCLRQAKVAIIPHFSEVIAQTKGPTITENLLERTASASTYPLLIKNLLHQPVFGKTDKKTLWSKYL